MQTFANGTEHLLAELEWLDLLLRRQVLRLRAAHLLTEDQFRGLYIPDALADVLLSQSRPGASPPDGEQAGPLALTARISQVRAEIDARRQAASLSGLELPLPFLSAAFGLAPFETSALLVSIAPELDLRYEILFSYVQNDVAKKRPSIDLVLQLLCSSLEERLIRRSSFAPDAPLLRHGLLRLIDDPQDREPPLPARYPKVEERIVSFLLDEDQIDGRLLPFTRLVRPALCTSELAVPAGLAGQLSQAVRSFSPGEVIYLFHGPPGAGKQAAAEAMCAEIDRPLLVADLGQALAQERLLAEAAACLRREAVLQGAGLFLKGFESLLDGERRSTQPALVLGVELARSGLPIFLGCKIPWQPEGPWAEADSLAFEFPLPALPLRIQLWQQALGGNGHPTGPDVVALADKFTLGADQIQAAARSASHLAVLRGLEKGAISSADLHRAARLQSNQALRRLAQKVEPIYSWADIVLPPRTMQQLKQVCASIRYHPVVYEGWGFDGKLSVGKGLNVLFAGPSGTGKTMAAQILAQEFELDLYKIDLSSVVSKYIGETEKNLSRIFHEAESSNAILFFDEADALFGKRSEVKDAHDRYANIEVAYLLQKIEEYEGIAILATNMSKNLDEAFTRRLHHTVEFPFPDIEYRRRIWHILFPPDAPLAPDVDFDYLATRFELAGGNIRNIVLASAFLAAEGGGPIRMQHLIHATASELQKMGRLPSRSEFGAYYEMIRERSEPR